MLNRSYNQEPSYRSRLLGLGSLKQILTLITIVGLLMAFVPTVKTDPQTQPTQAEAIVISDPGTTIQAEITASQADDRAIKLQSYLESKGSPLSLYATDFISAADQFGIDWKLLPAIAGNESGFAKAYVGGTYNAWGWGGGYLRFSSWSDAIYSISKALKENYYNKGATNPYQIAPIYAPPSTTWAGNVLMFENQISAN